MASPNSCLLVTTTTWRAPPVFEVIIMDGTTAQTTINAGVMSVMMRNTLVRTLCRYSRFVISQMLRRLLCIGLPHYVNKDVFERRLGEFESVDASAFGGELEQRLRIG